MEPLQIAVITGSTREHRFGPVVSRWLLDRIAERPDVEADHIDVAEIGVRPHLFAAPDAREQAYLDRLERADAFVVVTPEYNHSFPGTLKNAIDVARSQWRHKVVAFVSYGGLSGGLRAVEGLRLVFAELHAATVRETVSFHRYPEVFDDEGRPRDAAGTAAAATVLLDELAWWGQALRVARIRSEEAEAAA